MQFFYDKDNNEYRAEQLSEGGQGVVYVTEDKKLAVKVSNKDEKYEEYLKKLAPALSVFVEESVHIAFPIVALKDECGYVMEFLEGGRDMGHMLITSGKKDELLKKYNSTGGLKRRLLLLADLAKTLHGLHKFGYIYGDISDKNVFVSAMPTRTEKDENGKKITVIDLTELNETNTRICLIDADNVKKFTDYSSMIYTPGFGAPELVNRVCSNSIASDIYSFALLAYRLLNINGPFDCEEEEECGWDDDTVTGQEADTSSAERGEKAFIFDEEDVSNHVRAGIIPYSFGCTEKLIALFRKVFSYSSRMLLTERPTAFSWACALYEAVDSLVYCPKCQAHHYYFAIPCDSLFNGVVAHIDYLNPVDGNYVVSDTGDTVLNDFGTRIYDRMTQRTDLNKYRIFDIKLLERGGFVIENPNAEYEYSVFKNGTLSSGNYNVKNCEVWISKKRSEEYFARLRFEVRE